MFFIAIAAVVLFGSTRLSAQKAATVQTRSDPVGELNELLAEKDAQIAVLIEQLGFARQAAIRTEERIDVQQDTILEFQEIERRNDDVEVDAFERWQIGYAIGGGENLRAFERVILPCESGGESDPDAAIGPTDDWGRAHRRLGSSTDQPSHLVEPIRRTNRRELRGLLPSTPAQRIHGGQNRDRTSERTERLDLLAPSLVVLGD